MADDAVVYVELPQDQKDSWKSYIKNDEDAANLTHLVKLAVEERISETDDEVSGGVDRAELEEFRAQVDQKFTEVTDSLEVVKSSVRNNPELEMLKADIYEELPKLSQSEVRDIVHEGGPEEWGFTAMTVEGLAKELDRTEEFTREAVEQLRIYGPDVVVADKHDTRYYYREA